MPNLYARLAAVKDDLGLTTTTHDATLLRLIESVSRGFDDVTGRRFYSEVAARYFDGRSFDRLLLQNDVLSATTLKVDAGGDGTYEMTLASPADYWFWPDNEFPKRRVDLNPNGSQLGAWPEGRRRVEIVGTFGYSNDTELTGATVNDDGGSMDTSETAVTVSNGSLFSAGDTLVIEAEQLYVSAAPTSGVANDLTVRRGMNGTTSATHANGVAISRRRYPPAIELATLMQVSRIHKQIETGFAGNVAAGDVGGFSFTSLFPAIRDLIQPYIIPVIG